VAGSSSPDRLLLAKTGHHITLTPQLLLKESFQDHNRRSGSRLGQGLPLCEHTWQPSDAAMHVRPGRVPGNTCLASDRDSASHGTAAHQQLGEFRKQASQRTLHLLLDSA